MSKYPNEIRELARILHDGGAELYVVTDQHNHESCVQQVHNNGFSFIPRERILCSDYACYGEECKAKILDEHGIDFLMDDFPGYCAAQTNAITLFVWPKVDRDYFHKDWWTDGSEGNFGRRRSGSRNPMTNTEAVTPSPPPAPSKPPAHSGK